MQKIIWTNDYSVGVEELDKQHKKIIELINALIEDSNSSVDSESTFKVLQEMMSYAQKHLDYEERLLEEHQFFDLMNHASTHVKYLERVAQFSFDTMAHDENIPDALLGFLKKWWQDHILIEDMKYKPFFNERGVK